MELFQLQSFQAVASLGGFTRAAEAMHLTQPAVTRQIASLEKELHTRLFDRLGKTVKLTTAGEALLKYAESIMRLEKEAKQAISDIGSGAAGRLTLGASSTIATYVLPSILKRYHSEFPKIEIAVHTGISAQVLEMVLSNVVDIGLVTSVAKDDTLQSLDLGDYDTCVVTPPEHPLAFRESISAADLANSPLILMESGTNLRTYVDRLLNAAGVEEQVTMELDNVEAIKRMIEAGLGISMLPRVSINAEIESGRLVALPLADLPTANRQMRLTYRKDKYLNAAMKAFIDLLNISPLGIT